MLLLQLLLLFQRYARRVHYHRLFRCAPFSAVGRPVYGRWSVADHTWRSTTLRHRCMQPASTTNMEEAQQQRRLLPDAAHLEGASGIRLLNDGGVGCHGELGNHVTFRSRRVQMRRDSMYAPESTISRRSTVKARLSSLL